MTTPLERGLEIELLTEGEGGWEVIDGEGLEGAVSEDGEGAGEGN